MRVHFIELKCTLIVFGPAIVSILFHRPNNKLKRCLFYRNQILRQYTRAAGGCTYACLLGVQMDGDCTASSQLVYMCGGVYIAVAEGNQAELPRTGGCDMQAATRFIRDRLPNAYPYGFR